MTRRALLLLALAASLVAASCADSKPDLPNVLWITVEDMSPNLGTWGDPYARTPNIDRLASESVRYTSAFATAPVCSPSRSTLITGVYATSLGTQRLRSRFPIPESIRGYPSFLRAAGYYTTNNVKTDYNTVDEARLIAESWDDSSETAHWRGRGEGQPFFAIFNDLTTHQSRSMSWGYEEFQEKVQSLLTADEIHDPAEAPVPPYYPDTPVVRKTIARYYDCITAMDKNVGRILAELEEDGLAEDTLVFFYSDHGAGLPRHKRDLHDSGAHVPLLIRFPEKYQHLAPAAPGETIDRLVSFVDFPPTLLSLLGLEVPDTLQGTPFLGPAAGEPRAYVFGARDRIDEAYDLARSVRDHEYLYIRTYMPHLSYNQPSAYSDTADIRKEIETLAERGRLTGAQLDYAGPSRPREELYAVREDPQQVKNLVYSDDHQEALTRMRREMERWIRGSHDLGFLPEADVWARIGDSTTPYDLARDPAAYPQARITAAAAMVGREDALEDQTELLGDPDAAVRYWAAVGLAASARSPVKSRGALRAALGDPSAVVRIAAADALARHARREVEETAEDAPVPVPAPADGTEAEPEADSDGQADLEAALGVLQNELLGDDLDAALLACRIIELLGERARPAAGSMRSAAARFEATEGDQALFIRFSTSAFLSRLGR
jgi:arylsulfatase A-like enzyme